jgi:PAS domain S-box-containing protein
VKRLFALLEPPRFDDAEKSRQAELLNAISILLIFILSLLVSWNLLGDPDFGRAVNTILILLLVYQVVTQFLIRSGYVPFAGLSLLFLSWVGITWFAWRSDGVRDVALFAYFTILLGAGYMFGWRAVMVFAAWSILAVWLLAFYEIEGITHRTLSEPARVAIYVTALLVLVSFQVYYVINTLKKAIQESTHELRTRKHMENVLRDEQEKLKLALDAAKMGTWNWIIETGAVEWSGEIEALFGLPKGGFDGQYSSYLSMIHPEDLPHIQSCIQRALEDKDFDYLVEHRILMPGGGIRWLEGRGNVYRDATGQAIRMAGTVVDVTERKRSEQALRDAEEKYRNMVENSAHGIFQSTPDGTFLNMNTTMAHIYGYDTPEEYIAAVSTISEQVYVEASERERFIRQLEDNNEIIRFETRNRRKDGSIIWISSNAHAVKDDSGKTLYYEGTVEDITDRKEAEAERERLLTELSSKNAELERFVYTVSHDLKSPLVTIVGFLGYLEDDFQAGNIEALHKDMERVYKAAFKMQDLLRDLLDLSRIGRMMNPPELVSFDELVNEALELTEGRLHERGVSVHIASHLPNVYGDAKRFLELVQNLLDNAAKYMGEQPEPLIEIGHDGFENGNPVFFVRDNGIGIAREHHEQIFGLFNKLDPNVEGTGVGLALVKRIVEFHGGRIWVESEAGKGATFWFTLPGGEKSTGDKSPESK